jgi:CheY-like chemotaxis protein
VEDEDDTRDAMLELLSRESYAALGAANGVEALRLLTRGRVPAVILLDLRMPVMDGWELCRVLQSSPNLAEIPIAIVSAMSEPRGLPERRYDAGLFRKPLDLDLLLKTVRACCR